MRLRMGNVMTCRSIARESDSWSDAGQRKCLDQDPRRNIYEIDDIKERYKVVVQQSLGVACLIKTKYLLEFDNGNYGLSPVHTKKLKHTVAKRNIPFGEQESFIDEPTPAYGTAFLVARRYAITAGHCLCEKGSNRLDEKKIEHTRFVLGFQKNQHTQSEYEFSAKDVFQFKVLAHQREGKIDWAFIKLDKNVEGRDPLPLNFTTEIALKKGLYMLGHPSGLPLKFVEGGEVKNDKDTYLHANLNSFSGNSGSPVFDEKKKKVVGILVRGRGADYICNDNYKNTGESRIEVHKVTDETSIYDHIQKLNRLTFVSDYLKAIEGDLEARYQIAVAYFQGTSEVSKKEKKAMRWLQIASLSGHTLSSKGLKTIEENWSSTALTYGQIACDQLTSEHRTALLKASGVALITIGILGIPGILLAQKWGREIYRTKHFELLALDDDRFRIFVYLSRDQQKKAEERFMLYEDFYRRLFTTEAFHNALNNNHSLDRQEKYLSFFASKDLVLNQL